MERDQRSRLVSPPGPYRPRINAEVTPEQYAKFQELLPFGWQKPLMQCLIDGVIALHERGGLPALSALIAGHIEIEKLTDLSITSKLEALKDGPDPRLTNLNNSNVCSRCSGLIDGDPCSTSGTPHEENP
jgi:hypothetical protein